MKKMLHAIAITLIALFMSNCSSTNVVTSFSDPSANTVISNAKKVFVATLIKNEAASRNAETAICQAIGPKAVPGYTLMSNLTKDNAESYLVSNGFDVAVVSRLVSVDKNLDYVPGNYDSFPDYYGGFYGYWGMAYNNYYDPGYYQTTKSYKVETNVYDLKNNKLVYSAITDSYSPSSFDSGMSDIIGAIKGDLQKKGVIAK